MEVMSPLLFCALVTLLPQTLGHTFKGSFRDLKPNNTLLLQQKSSHKLLLNLNEPPYVQVSDMQAVFHDILCQNCLDCMQRAIRAHKIHSKSIIRLSNSEEMHNEIVSNKIKNRTKRDISYMNTTEVEFKNETKSKSKKNKVHKSVTVTKYNINGKVTALKVTEINPLLVSENQTTKSSPTTCEVYSIKKSFPCNSPEGDLMVKLAKRKSNKKNKKAKEKYMEQSQVETERPMAIFRKREVDNSQIPESVISSVEEYY